MKTSTLNTLLDRYLKAEKDNEVLRYKNTQLNGIMQSQNSKITQLKAQIVALKNGVDVTAEEKQ
jgi:hypothetical protein